MCVTDHRVERAPAAAAQSFRGVHAPVLSHTPPSPSAPSCLVFSPTKLIHSSSKAQLRWHLCADLLVHPIHTAHFYWNLFTSLFMTCGCPPLLCFPFFPTQTPRRFWVAPSHPRRLQWTSSAPASVAIRFRILLHTARHHSVEPGMFWP